MPEAVLCLAVLACLGLAALNGMNDLSAVSATLISTRAVSSRTAPILTISGVWLGIFFGGDAVTRTVTLGLLDGDGVSPRAMLNIWCGAAVGAILWGVLARRKGIPTSATHAYVGALCGAAFSATASLGMVHWGMADLAERHQVEGVMKVFVALLLSPLFGGGLGYIFHRLLARSLRRTTGTGATIRVMECITVLVQCFSYGLNDVHGLMGLLMGALLATGHTGIPFDVPMWVKVGTGVAISLGAATGSLRISRMMSRGLISVQPIEALSAQVAATSSVMLAALVGAPVSSTQVTSSALVGVGGAWRPRHVRWSKMREILLTWVVTFPCSMLVGAVLTALLRLLP